MRKFRGNYIQGQFLTAKDPNGEIVRRNPGNLSEPPLTFPYSFEHIHDAVSAAHRAFPVWSRLAPEDRSQRLKQYCTTLSEHSEELAQLISKETGKPIWESKLEITQCAQFIEYELSCEGPLEPVHILPKSGRMGYVRTIPRGVAAILAPPSLPVFSSHRHFIPALLHGNSVVLKPSSFTPSTGEYIAEIMHDSGIPSGVFNVIQGESEVARRLVSHANVDLVFFSGSFETGFKIQKQLVSDYWKTVVLEMAGKNSTVIWNDCDYHKALLESVYSAFLTAGQRCQSTHRLIIHSEVFDRFVKDFHNMAKRCRVDYAFTIAQTNPFMGPLLSESTLENYLRYQGIAVRENCEEVMRGKPLDRDQRGYYVSPSIHIVNQVDPKSIYQREEISGPNVAIYRVVALEEVCDIINQSPYGLLTSFYTNTREHFLYLSENAKVGITYRNLPTVVLNPQLPYGGLKKSGNHRPMGSFSKFQCTSPVSCLEMPGSEMAVEIPDGFPDVE